MMASVSLRSPAHAARGPAARAGRERGNRPRLAWLAAFSGNRPGQGFFQFSRAAETDS